MNNECLFCRLNEFGLPSLHRLLPIPPQLPLFFTNPLQFALFLPTSPQLVQSLSHRGQRAVRLSRRTLFLSQYLPLFRLHDAIQPRRLANRTLFDTDGSGLLGIHAVRRGHCAARDGVLDARHDGVSLFLHSPDSVEESVFVCGATDGHGGYDMFLFGGGVRIQLLAWHAPFTRV